MGAGGPAASSALHLVGGRFRPETQSVCGPQVAEAMGDFSADLALLGASAIRDGSYYNCHPEDAAIQRRMVEIAREAWLLADASKLSAVALGRVGALRDLTGVVTDGTVTSEQLQELRAWCQQVVVAQPEPAQADAMPA